MGVENGVPTWAWYKTKESPYGPVVFVPAGGVKIEYLRHEGTSNPARFKGQEEHDDVVYDVYVFDKP